MAAFAYPSPDLVLTREFPVARGWSKRQIHEQTQIINLPEAHSPKGFQPYPDCPTEKRNSAHG